MYKYEKIEHETNIPIKLHNFYFENYSSEGIGKHWHRSIELLIPLYGNFDLWINGDITTIHAGELFIVNSQEIHEIIPHHYEEYYKGYALQIDYDYIKKCYPDIEKKLFHQPDDNTKNILLKNIFDIIRYYYDHNTYNYIRINSYIQMLIFLLLNNLSYEKKNTLELKTNKNKERIIQILHYIDENYTESLSGSSISHTFYISEGYLYKLFKDNFNITLKQYINLVRLNHAKNELVNSNYPIVEIAINNGFPNIKSFNQIFKKQMGISPKEYRTKMKTN